MREATTNKPVSGWAGWLYFAGMMLILAGFLNAMAGLVAIFKNEVYVAGPESLWIFDFTTWGWTYLILGAVIFFAGLSLMYGSMFGRVIAVIAAILSAIANFGFIPVYPLWSILLIALDVVIIYAVVAHGDELQP